MCILRLSNALCIHPIEYNSMRVNGMSLTFTISSCCVKASKAKRWMCGSWLTFTTLESWAPLSNPSIDRERNETMNHTSLFLVSASQMALADVIPCLLSLVFIHNILRNFSLALFLL